MILDCKGKPCPQPVVLAMQALAALPQGETLTVIVDNEAAVGNVIRMAQGRGCTVKAEAKPDGTTELLILPDGNAVPRKEEKAAKACGCGGTVVVIGTDRMGEGDPKLGAMLMKAYLYALAQMPEEELPQTVIFFNGGAKLTVMDSASLDDIRCLGERGTEILTCGTCLDFYGIKDRLAVGLVTNMYTIAEKQLTAGKVIRL